MKVRSTYATPETRKAPEGASGEAAERLLAEPADNLAKAPLGDAWQDFDSGDRSDGGDDGVSVYSGSNGGEIHRSILDC